VVKAFAKVKEVFGVPPSFVVYHGSSATFTPADNPFYLSLRDFRRDTAVNLDSAFVAAQQAVSGFE